MTLPYTTSAINYTCLLLQNFNYGITLLENLAHRSYIKIVWFENFKALLIWLKNIFKNILKLLHGIFTTEIGKNRRKNGTHQILQVAQFMWKAFRKKIISIKHFLEIEGGKELGRLER